MYLNKFYKHFLLALIVNLSLYCEELENKDSYEKYNFIISNSSKDKIDLTLNNQTKFDYKFNYLLNKDENSVNNKNIVTENFHNFIFSKDIYSNNSLFLGVNYNFEISETDLISYKKKIIDKSKKSNFLVGYKLNDKILTKLNFENLKNTNKQKRLKITTEYSYNKVKFFNKIKFGNSTTHSFGTTFYKKYNSKEFKIDITAKNLLTKNEVLEGKSKNIFMNLSMLF